MYNDRFIRDYTRLLHDYTRLFLRLSFRLFFRLCRLFFRLFPIIPGCLHPENGNVQTAILDPFTKEWLTCVDEECPFNCLNWKVLLKNGKSPDGAFLYYYTHYFYYYTHYFSRLTRIAVAVSTSYALQIYVQRFCALLQA